MLRVLSVALVIGCMGALPALAQDANQSSLAQSTPQVNASGGGITLRAPGKWVVAAIARHNSLMGLRLTGPRFGQPNEEEGALRAAGSSGSSSTSSSGLSGIMGLINQFASSGSVGDLSGTIESLTGTPASGSTSGTTGTDGMDPRLAGLLALRDANKKSSSNQTNNGQAVAGKSVLKTSTTQERNGRTFGGAIARLPKADQRFQEVTDQPKFATRWANAMLQTFFTTLTVGLQSRSFIDTIKDGLRPLILPPADSGSGDGSSGDGSSGDGSSGDGSSGDGSSDSGIEDLPPPSDGSGSDTGSI